MNRAKPVIALTAMSAEMGLWKETTGNASVKKLERKLTSKETVKFATLSAANHAQWENPTFVRSVEQT